MNGRGSVSRVHPYLLGSPSRGAFYLLVMFGLTSCATAPASLTPVAHPFPPGTLVRFGPEGEGGVGSLEFLPSGDVVLSGPGAACRPEGRRRASVVEESGLGMEIGKAVLPPWGPWLEETDSGIRVECGDLRVTVERGESDVLIGHVESRVTWTSEVRSPLRSCAIYGYPYYSEPQPQCAVFSSIPLKARVWKRNRWVLWEVGKG